jgi:hypothetical protein
MQYPYDCADHRSWSSKKQVRPLSIVDSLQIGLRGKTSKGVVCFVRRPSTVGHE